MFFSIQNLLAGVVVCLCCTFALESAEADVLEKMPDSAACRTLKNDIVPNSDSQQNREDLDFLMTGTVQQGRDGEQCGIFKRDRSKIKNSNDLHLSGISAYSRERVFAYGRSCLLDWCDEGSGAPQAEQSEPEASESEDLWTSPPATSPLPPAASRDNGSYTLRMCNYTSIPILYVAIALTDQPEDEFPTIRAWFGIARNQCYDWTRKLGKYTRHTIAYRVEGDIIRNGTTVRTVIAGQGATTSFCVGDAHTSTYVRKSTKNYRCRSGERYETFWLITVGNGVTTIPFTAPR